MKFSVAIFSILAGAAIAKPTCSSNSIDIVDSDYKQAYHDLHKEYTSAIRESGASNQFRAQGCCDRTPCFVGCFVNGVWQVSVYQVASMF
ncbi:uncharacterized protein ARB_07381 [Trichophyton benhamiae CBS 112371]|uniref:Uncharacterized protein n=1 Tax=Arthroderma benhamiae (strain ATCC MYA-4681 / CBS 112371) TaxID=663331 RepID=D4AT17_ARTBC|nr:uncharacterized protein ARB_07381 [Trichophyton benhamiae CBS 112371]EFE33917.1 hypothetical protein ARB_07381 [Trichophyton benhamiae CBS 112371]